MQISVEIKYVFLKNGTVPLTDCYTWLILAHVHRNVSGFDQSDLEGMLNCLQLFRLYI